MSAHSLLFSDSRTGNGWIASSRPSWSGWLSPSTTLIALACAKHGIESHRSPAATSRSKPLVRGSRKEEYAREYVARRLLHVSRRYVKKFGIPNPEDEVTGYENMEEVCRDLEEVVDILWFSGTPSLQVPYLLNVALAFNTYLPSFPPAPRLRLPCFEKWITALRAYLWGTM